MTGLPTGWEWTTLNEVQADEPRAITDGPFGSSLTSGHYTASGARVVRLQNIGDGVFNDAEAYVSMSHFESLKKHEVQANDLLVASLGETLPRACLAPSTLGPALVKADCIRVRLGAGIEPRWALYALQTPYVRKWAGDQLHGVGRPRLGLKVIRALPVPLPPVSEQRRIVDLLEDHLTRLDAAKASLAAGVRRANALYASHLWGLTHRVEGDRVPLDSVAEVRLGRQRSPANHTGNSMWRYLRAANVDWDTLRLDEVKVMNFTANEASSYRLKEGDILLVEASGSSGEVGKSAVYRGEAGAVCFQNTLLRVRCHGVEPAFMQKYLLAEAMNGRFKVGARGVGIHHIGRSRIASWPVVVPTRHDQAAVVEAADELAGAKLRLTAAAQSARAGMTRLRQALMSAAFAGRL